MLGDIFAPLAMKVAGGFILLLAIALAVVMWRADVISDQRDKLRDQLSVSEANHAVTVASLNSLSEQMEAMVRDGELRKERLADAMQQAQDDADELRREADAIRAEAPGSDCMTP
jgi:hypothetical protein